MASKFIHSCKKTKMPRPLSDDLRHLNRRLDPNPENELVVEYDLDKFNKFWFTTNHFKDRKEIKSSIDHFEGFTTLRRIHLTLSKSDPLVGKLGTLANYKYLQHLELDLHSFIPQTIVLPEVRILSLKERTRSDQNTANDGFYIHAPNLKRLRCPQFPDYLHINENDHAKFEQLQHLETETPLSIFANLERFKFDNLKKLHLVNINDFDIDENYTNLLEMVFPALEIIYFYYNYRLTKDRTAKKDDIEFSYSPVSTLFVQIGTHMLVPKITELKIYVQGVRIKNTKDLDDLLIMTNRRDTEENFLLGVHQIQFRKTDVNEMADLFQIVPDASFYKSQIPLFEELNVDNRLVFPFRIRTKLSYKFFNIQKAIFYHQDDNHRDLIINILLELEALNHLVLDKCDIDQYVCNALPTLPYLHVLEIEDRLYFGTDPPNYDAKTKSEASPLLFLNFLERFNLRTLKLKGLKILKGVADYLFVGLNLRIFELEDMHLSVKIIDDENVQYGCDRYSVEFRNEKRKLFDKVWEALMYFNDAYRDRDPKYLADKWLKYQLDI